MSEARVSRHPLLASTASVALIAMSGTSCQDASSLLEPDAAGPEPPTFSEPVVSGSAILVGAGDIASSSGEQAATAALLDHVIAQNGGNLPLEIFTTGDNAYSDGTYQQFLDYYDPTWGAGGKKALTRPTPGNHDYRTVGAAGYFMYFGAAAQGPSGEPYYSYDIGAWHAIALNSEIGVSSGDPQLLWLEADLQAEAAHQCTIAYWHQPLFSSGDHGNDLSYRDIWETLYAFGVEVVLAGHDHTYERFGPQDPYAVADPAYGIRQFTVGTGGRSLRGFGTPEPNSEARLVEHGVLKLTLLDNGYEWQFIAVDGTTSGAVLDEGSGSCHGPPGGPPAGPLADFTWTEGPPLTIQFQDASTPSSGTITEWSWDFGDGVGTSTLQNPSYTYAATGSYPVSLTVTDEQAQASTKVKSVDAGPKPPTADFTWQLQSQSTVAFTDASSDPDGTVAEWLWDFGDGSTSTLQNPTHTYAASGVYTVSLTVIDQDEMTGATSQDVILGATTLSIRVDASTDDTEEEDTGKIDINSSDLELVEESTIQTVGMRFNGLTIPQGAAIANASIQFQVDEVDTGAASLTIRGQAVDDAPVFTTASFDVSSRSTTTSSVSWSPPAWSTRGEAGEDQKTPDIASVIQEIVSRPGWSSGNSLAIIVTGSGTRTAEAFDGDASGAALLDVEYVVGGPPPPPNDAPVADNVTITGTAQVGAVLMGTYTYSDTEADLEGTSTFRWLRDGSPIGGATAETYTLVTDDANAQIVFEVTPVALTGTSHGAPAVSAPTAPVAAPVSVTMLDPSSMPRGATTNVMITGTSFATGATVTVESGKGPTPAVSNVVWVDSTTITATFTTKNGGPRGSLTWDVRVTNPGGGTDVLVGGLTVTQ